LRIGEVVVKKQTIRYTFFNRKKREIFEQYMHMLALQFFRQRSSFQAKQQNAYITEDKE